ncbi:MAG: MBL fold metallo-hydrolase [Armatimonadetes bacterium]|nr:MBL fold metallo-hydrolase [Armatimonadota bacterium]
MLLSAVVLKWLGHACFLITLINGTRIVTDPFNPKIGYPSPSVLAHVATVSHEHFDHNNVGVLKGQPQVLRQAGDPGIKGVRFRWIATSHDASGGRERGKNAALVIEDHGLAICHLGDLGHVLSPAQVKAIGRVDALLIPVGGVYAIGPREADRVVRQLKPKVAIPMHYKTPALALDLESVKAFTEGKADVVYAKTDTYSVSRKTLPKETRIVVLKPPR